MRLLEPPPPPPGAPTPPPPPPPPAGPGAGARVWLLRHAQVAQEVNGIAYGSRDVPLSPEGEEQTQRAGERFTGVDVTRILSSDLVRALALGQAVAAACGAPLETDAALREVCRGAWEGLPKPEFRSRWAADAERYWRDPYRWSTPGGDSDERLFTRGFEALEAGLRAVEGGTLVVTAHSNLIRVLTGRLLGATVAESYRYGTSAARGHLLVDAPGGFRLERLDTLPEGQTCRPGS